MLQIEIVDRWDTKHSLSIYTSMKSEIQFSIYIITGGLKDMLIERLLTFTVLDGTWFFVHSLKITRKQCIFGYMGMLLKNYLLRLIYCVSHFTMFQSFSLPCLISFIAMVAFLAYWFKMVYQTASMSISLFSRNYLPSIDGNLFYSYGYCVTSITIGYEFHF